MTRNWPTTAAAQRSPGDSGGGSLGCTEFLAAHTKVRRQPLAAATPIPSWRAAERITAGTPTFPTARKAITFALLFSTKRKTTSCSPQEWSSTSRQYGSRRAQDCSVEHAFSSAQAAPVGKDHLHAPKDAHLALQAGIPQPAPRAEKPRGVRDSAMVEEWSELDSEKTIPVNILIHLPVRKEISPPEQRSSLPAVHRSGMAAEPQIIVALHSELEKLIERGFASRCACANLPSHLEVISFRAREPVRVKRSPESREGPERVCKLAARPGLDRRIEREAALGNAQQSALNAHPARERTPSSRNPAHRR